MRCPACFNPLTQVQVGTLVVDACQGGCGGIWFDAFELQRVEDAESATGEGLLHIARAENLTVDPGRKRECPRCPEVKLHRHFFSAKRRIEVDECPNCGGYWLDAGELEQIRAERRESAGGEGADTAALSADTIRYLYRLRSAKRPT